MPVSGASVTCNVQAYLSLSQDDLAKPVTQAVLECFQALLVAAMAAELEPLFRLQLEELEQGQHAQDDLDMAYQVQLCEALAASGAMAGAPALETSYATEAGRFSGSDHQIRDLMNSQAGWRRFTFQQSRVGLESRSTAFKVTCCARQAQELALALQSCGDSCKAAQASSECQRLSELQHHDHDVARWLNSIPEPEWGQVYCLQAH